MQPSHLTAADAEGDKPPTVEYTFRRYQPLLHVLAAVLSVSVTWYIATATATHAKDSRIEQNSAKIAENSKQIEDLNKKIDVALEKVLTKEVFEEYRRADAERAERMERMLTQLLSRSE